MDPEEGTSASTSQGSTNKEEPPEVNSAENKTEEEIPYEDRTFGEHTVNVIASAIGISNITDEASQYVADNLSYKMKELIYISKIVLHRNKGGMLCSDDVKKALSMVGMCEVYGHSSKEDVNFIYIPKADVYCEEEPEIELAEPATTDTEYTQQGDPYIQGAWIMTKDYSEEPSLSQPSSYYLQIAKTIMTGSPAHLKVALSDLRTNPKIGPVCPYFLNLVALTVKKVPRDTHLTNALIGTVHAIAHNQFVDPSPYLAVNRAANSLLKIVIEVNTEKNYDDLPIRVRAGLLLAKVVLIWSIELDVQINIVRHLLQHLLDPNLPLQSHYGAIVALTALDQRTLDFQLWHVMEKYFAVLENRVGSVPDVMVLHVLTAILVAARSTNRKDQISKEQLRGLSKVDQMLYNSFGDTVTPFRMVCSGPPIYPCVKKNPNLSRLRLKINTAPVSYPKCNPINVGEVFDISFKADPSKLPAATYYNASLVKQKPAFVYVTRNYRFCAKLYKNSAVGDLLTVL